MTPDPTTVPFSVPLSYLALGADKRGLLLRTLRTSADQLQAARLVPLAADGRPLDVLRYDMRPESLRAETEAGAGGRIGLIECAHRGTLFLDGIEHMSPRLQASLLRMLKDRDHVDIT